MKQMSNEEQIQENVNLSADDELKQNEQEMTTEAQINDENPASESNVSSGMNEENRIDALQKEVDELKDKWLRAIAENDNYKKRVRREISDAVFRAQQSLLSSFLPTVDNLDRALTLAADQEQLAQGIRMVLGEFMHALAKHGIEPVPSVGSLFDPAVHDALQQIDSDEHAPGTIIQEFEKGFRMGDKLLRPARVIIASAESTGKEKEAPKGLEEHPHN